jgi:hypothetical protein
MGRQGWEEGMAVGELELRVEVFVMKISRYP